MMDTLVNPPWWKTLYDKNLAMMLLENADPKEAEQTLIFMQKIMGLKAGQRVFDQCCGTGRLAELLVRDHEVIGVDLIAEYIDIAKSKTRHVAKKSQFYCDDAMTFRLQTPADIAINWWTSFAYSLDDDVNLQMIQCSYESIKQGGYFALDFMNVPGLFRYFETDVMRKIKLDNNEMVLIRHSEIDFERGVLMKDWHYFIENDKNVSHKSEVKLYSPAQLIQMFLKVGFKHIKLFGDLEGNVLSLDSPRCIVVGQRL